jgi:transposase
MATEALIVHVVVSKFCDGLPLYRQSQMLLKAQQINKSDALPAIGEDCIFCDAEPLGKLFPG